MTKYEVKTADGVIHRIEASTHVLDSNGLTLYVDGGKAVAIFAKFEWMREAATETSVAVQPEAPADSGAGEVVTPVAGGE
ncbi:hypothetical protein [Pseudomonas sp. NUPR-001]|uniref:hypothetical protein n=1 Tax=Pseudomonas sp. NUPR-001 TaxID=3416058 RepID=UPI003F99D7DF